MNAFNVFFEKYFKSATNIIFGLSLLIILLQIIQSGFGYFHEEHFNLIYKPFNLIFSVSALLLSLNLYVTTNNIVIKIARLIFLVITLIYVMMSFFWLTGLLYEYFDADGYRIFLAIFVGFMAISFKVSSLGSTTLHPALLFILSFIFLILFGTFALMLPSATVNGITFLKALFTATSAVTVTGLAVLDTGKDFSIFGQTIILILIQLGGLGVLTVTNVFALIFKSTTTFKNRMMLSDMIKEMQNNNTFLPL